MDTTPVERMRTLFGMNPGAVPPAMQFPRLPPGAMHPATSRFAVPPGTGKKGAAVTGEAAALVPDLEDFQQSYRAHAAGLLDSGSRGIVPPGHPMYKKQASISVLKSENDRLLKENADLKKQLQDGTAGQDRV